MKYLFFIGVLTLVFGSCEDKKTTYETDDELIQDYLAKANINATKHESGLYYIIEEEGNGAHPTYYDNIVVNYYGYYVDSTSFDEGTSVDFPLSHLYKGWQYGLPLFGQGGKGTLFLPRHLANSQAVMIFDIELLNVWTP